MTASTFPIPDTIMTDLRAGQAREVLRQLARTLERTTGVAAERIHAALVAAEGLGGSAIGDGVAVIGAHLPLKECGRRLSSFAMLARPVLFKGVDNHPCDMVYVLISPQEESQSHLRDLSSVIRAFRDNDFHSRLRGCDTADRMLSLFKGRDVRPHAAAA